jgi:hypothetical protein
MRAQIFAVWFGLCVGLAAEPACADMPWWISFGPNFTHVDRADLNCGGGQAGGAFGSKLRVKVQYTRVSFEDDDDGGDCDLGLYGDSAAGERAVMAGFASRDGWFLVAGPARVHVHETRYGAWGEDTGTRVELGFGSRARTGDVAGFEVLLFRTENEVRDYAGGAINWTFGSRGAARRKPGSASGRY